MRPWVSRIVHLPDEGVCFMTLSSGKVKSSTYDRIMIGNY